MASASEPAALMVKNAALKNAANWIAMKQGYTRAMKEEQLEVVVVFLSESVTLLPFILLDLGKVSAMHACLLLPVD